MKIKTSITLSEELLEAIDTRARRCKKNRSEYIELAVAAYLDHMARAEQDARDLEIINRQFKELNREAEDVLAYQVPL
jgi:metal-responsive CopG/Arc/MetJ family transcriptional regulator